MSNILQLDFWQLAEACGAVAGAIIAAFWALFRMLLQQFNASLDGRFDALETARQESTAQATEQFRQIQQKQADLEKDFLQKHADLERNFLLLRGELPDKYVRREDAIRSETTLHAKLDGLALRIENAFMKAKN